MGKFTMGLFRRVERCRELDADQVDFVDWWLAGLVGSRCCGGDDRGWGNLRWGCSGGSKGARNWTRIRWIDGCWREVRFLGSRRCEQAALGVWGTH